jgi:hypothetical protein
MSFGEIFLNILGIIGIIAAASFIIVWVADLLIGVIDGRGGLFFKRTNGYENQQQFDDYQDRQRLTSNQKMLTMNNDHSQDEQEVKAEDNNKVDYDKAKQEEDELNAKLAKENEEQEAAKQKENDEKEQRIAELEKKTKELEEMMAKKQETPAPAPVQEPETKQVEDKDSSSLDDDYDSIIKAISEQSAEEDKNSLVDTTTTDEEPAKEEDNGSYDDNFDYSATVDQEPTEPVNEEPVVDTEKDDLKKQLEDLRQQLEQERNEKAEYQSQIDTVKQTNEELANKLQETQNMMAEQEQEDAKQNAEPTLLSEDEYLSRIAVLEQRQLENDKELRRTRREYKPLARVKNTLDRDKQKLRRKEAIVAKQKVVLYGVNNYLDIDEDKAKKLSEEIDLLEGLRTSVKHCEEIMDTNKDRYPILEQNYNLLVKNANQIQSDLDDAKAKLAEVRAKDSNNADTTDATTQETAPVDTESKPADIKPTTTENKPVDVKPATTESKPTTVKPVDGNK